MAIAMYGAQWVIVESELQTLLGGRRAPGIRMEIRPESPNVDKHTSGEVEKWEADS